ncbi:aldehyde dehydrogenase family protein (plasmid) [Mesorhizobium sp. ORM8.1]
MLELLINGKLVKGASALDVVNPATGEVFATCARASLAQLNDAVAAAKAAFPAWAALPHAKRQEYLNKVADVLEANHEDVARILTQEQGKPLPEATGEVVWAAMGIRDIAKIELPVEVLEDSATRRIENHRKPLGVVAAINPWNFPIITPVLKIALALTAGNTVVLKPAPTTPLSMLRFGELVKDILPPGVINIIADANDLGDALSGHPDVASVTFTGSTATGKKVMASAAETVKRVTLELGGNDPAIVLDDVEPKKVAPDIFARAFGNAGQVCVAIKRLYVHDSIYDAMCKELVSLAKNAVVDDGMKQGTTLGPVQNKAQYEKLKGFLADARRDGKVITGGNVIDRPGYFIEPTIVSDIKDGSRLVDEEQFGPILPVIRFSDVDDVVQRANASLYGLTASVWSANKERAYEIANRIEAGSIWINKHNDIVTHAPFGGTKQSGFGVEFGLDGVKEFTRPHVISI